MYLLKLHPLLINFLIFISSSDINNDLIIVKTGAQIVYAIIPCSASMLSEIQGKMFFLYNTYK